MITGLDRIKAAIKAELKADGCTQADLARYLGLTQKHVSQVFTGKVQGSHVVLEAMARAVGLTISVRSDSDNSLHAGIHGETTTEER